MFKYLKYAQYVCLHKYYVFRECCKLGIPLRGILHDMSKFYPVEFFAYADYFYGKHREKTYNTETGQWEDNLQADMVKDNFDIAWSHHKYRNPHHWEYWVQTNPIYGEVIVAMDDTSIKEMVADWVGAGLAITGKKDVKTWYEKNYGSMKMHPDTKVKVRKLIEEVG